MSEVSEVSEVNGKMNEWVRGNSKVLRSHKVNQ